MTRQPHLFDASTATVRTRQGQLFEDGRRESGLSCECGEPLVRTQGGFWCCPRGHGRLHELANDPARWEGDDADLFDGVG